MLSSIALPLLAALPYAMAAAPTRTPAQIANDPIAAEANAKVMRYTAWTWVAIVSAMLIYRWGLVLLRHVRRLANLNHGTSSDSKQKYFSIPNDGYSKIKRDIITAPLWKKRHNREFKLSAAANMGTLPGRLQTMFLLGYLGMQIAFCVWTIEWSNPELWYDDARNRSGVLSVMNMIPLFLLAGRNNPLIYLLGISFDTYNLIHRWLGRMVVMEGVIHTAFWMGGKTYEKGWAMGSTIIGKSLSTSPFIQTGMIGTGAFILLMLLSPSVVRHAFYETFLNIHRLCVIAALLGLYKHLELHHLPQVPWMHLVFFFWGAEWVCRWASIIYYGFGVRQRSSITVEAMPGEAVRLTINMVREWTPRPGCHVHMWMPALSLWSSHPFSVAWAATLTPESKEMTLPMLEGDVLALHGRPQKSKQISLVCRARTGLTRHMYEKACKSPNEQFTTFGFIEGPYGGHHSLDSYGTAVLFAGGVGITHQVMYLKHLVNGYNNGTTATQRIVLIWTVPTSDCLEWVRPWMDEVLRMKGRKQCLRIKLFISRPKGRVESSSETVKMYSGRPQVSSLIEDEVKNRVGAMAVTVCASGGMADGVRHAVRPFLTQGSVDFIEEAFTY